MINQLINLRKKLEADFSLENFPARAFESLAQFESSTSLEHFENYVAEWLLGLNILPAQVNLYNAFGEPSISLFNNGQFTVDIYFWRKNDTIIHSHGFRGAFKVLFGQSLHEEFSVKTLEDFEEDLTKSEVIASKIEILKQGDTRAILPGNHLVHRILHLDTPTVTLCLRTVNDKQLSQWHHLTTGLSYKQSNISPLTIKQILYFQYIFRSNTTTAKCYLKQVLNKLSISGQLSLIESLFQNEFGLDHDIVSIIIDILRDKFAKTSWFSFYEDHYEQVNQNLVEYEASKSSLKVLAHAINCNYNIEKTCQLLKILSTKNLEQLCQQLSSEESIFINDYYELQVQKIKAYSQS